MGRGQRLTRAPASRSARIVYLQTLVAGRRTSRRHPARRRLRVTAPLTASSVALTVSSASAVQGLPVELVATVTASSGTEIPTGSVNFMNGATTLGSAAVNGSGVAQFTSTLLPEGINTTNAMASVPLLA